MLRSVRRTRLEAWPNARPSFRAILRGSLCSHLRMRAVAFCGPLERATHLLPHRRPAAVPPSPTLAENLKSRIGHRNGVLQLDETARRMLQRGLHRDHHAGFERAVRVLVGIG